MFVSFDTPSASTPQPLVGVGGRGQAVRVGDARRVRRQRLAHLCRAADCRGALGSAVGEAQPHHDLGVEVGRLIDATAPLVGGAQQRNVRQGRGPAGMEFPLEVPIAAQKHALGQRRVQLATVGLHVHRQPGPVGGQVRRRREIQV